MGLAQQQERKKNKKKERGPAGLTRWASPRGALDRGGGGAGPAWACAGLGRGPRGGVLAHVAALGGGPARGGRAPPDERWRGDARRRGAGPMRAREAGTARIRPDPTGGEAGEAADGGAREQSSRRRVSRPWRRRGTPAGGAPAQRQRRGRDERR